MLPAQRMIRDQADAVCTADPVQAAVRDELLHIETHGTADGYEPEDITNTHVYTMVVNRDTKQAASAPLRVVTALVRRFAYEMHATVPDTLGAISMLFANPELGVAPPGVDVVGSIRAVMNEWELVDGWELYGIGVASMGHSVRTDEFDGDVNALSPEQVANHPASRALWYTHLVGVDSRVWTVMHQEGLDVVYGTNGPDEPCAGVMEVEALTRLVHAAQQ